MTLRLMGGASGNEMEEAILWVLNQSYGTQSLLDIAERSKLGFDTVSGAAEALLKSGLLRETK